MSASVRHRLTAHEIIIRNGIEMFNSDSEHFLDLVKAGDEMDLTARQARALVSAEMLHQKKVREEQQQQL